MAAEQPNLGTAGNYAVMAATTITNTGPTIVTSNMALSPGTAVTGFPPGTVNGEIDSGTDADAILAHTHLVTAYDDAAAETTTVNLTGTDLGGLTLTPGTYTFDDAAQLTGTLTLDGQGSTNATFIFQIGSALTTASNSTVSLVNGAGGCAVFWQVASSATLGTTTNFQGTIMAMASITMNTSATIGVGGLNHGGRALARTGAVTLDSNVITAPVGDCTFAAAPTETPVPTDVPSTVASAAPSAPAPVTTIPVLSVPAASPAPSMPDAAMSGSLDAGSTPLPLLAWLGSAALAGLSLKLVANRRRG